MIFAEGKMASLKPIQQPASGSQPRQPKGKELVRIIIDSVSSGRMIQNDVTIEAESDDDRIEQTIDMTNMKEVVEPQGAGVEYVEDDELFSKSNKFYPFKYHFLVLRMMKMMMPCLVKVTFSAECILSVISLSYSGILLRIYFQCADIESH